MTVTIAAVNALPYGEEIKELFLRHARPEFPDFFDRAYPAAFANGARSWVGRDPGGRLVMHIACFPHRFTFGDREVVGGLMANLMVAGPYRAFFPALKLIHRLMEDSKQRGDIDFLYADPNEESRALLRGTRFVMIGTLRRHVLPLGAPRVPIDLGIRTFHTGLRVVGRMPRRQRVVASPASEVRLDRLLPAAAQPGCFTPQHSESLYKTRLPGYPTDRDLWFTSSDAALLVRLPEAGNGRVAALRVVRWPAGFAPWSILPDVISELRRRGCDRLEVMTLAESDVGRVLRRAGFIQRSDTVPLFAYPLTPLGTDCVRAVAGWTITDLDCDR